VVTAPSTSGERDVNTDSCAEKFISIAAVAMSQQLFNHHERKLLILKRVQIQVFQDAHYIS